VLLTLTFLACAEKDDSSVIVNEEDSNNNEDNYELPSKNFMGLDRLLIGVQMEKETAESAPFDAWYRYLAAGFAENSSCMESCKADASCSSWWGCWQWDELPPGRYVVDHIENSKSMQYAAVDRPQIPVITYYQLLHSAKTDEGAAEVAMINDAAFLKSYLDDWRFLLQIIGDEKVLLHIEPDFWGFAYSVHRDPHAILAKVQEANSRDCARYEESVSGFAQCMIAMTRKYAPNATVGLHASPWDYQSTNNAQEVSNFMRELGATDGDFIVTDPSDRDAGWYEQQGQAWRWWDEQKASSYLEWSKTLSEYLDTPTILWQIPLGNMEQNNTIGHYQDNKLDWLFSHLQEVADSHIIGLFFGAGHHEQTTPETDGNNLINQTIKYQEDGGVLLNF
jgi:hypothetical protein